MAPTYTKITPSLPVTSIPESIKYYTEVLGFQIAGRDRDDHTWLQLANDEDQSKYDVDVNIYLRRRGFPDLGDHDVAFGKIYVRIGDGDGELEALLETLRQKGAIISDEITEKPWSLKDFTVKDHDGNLINFSQAIPGWKPPTWKE